MNKTPAWYDQSNLVRAYFADDYSGWVIDLKDGTCRLANDPILLAGDDRPKWGDRLELLPNVNGGMPAIGELIERYQED